MPPNTVAACQRAVKPPLIPIEEPDLQGVQPPAVAPGIHPHQTVGRPRHDQEMQDSAALVAQDQGPRRLVQGAPLRLVLRNLTVLDAPPERRELRVLLRVVVAPVPEGGAE